MAIHVDIADAIAADLNAATFSLPVAATRLYLPEFTPEDLSALRVPVVPRAQRREPKSRSLADREYDVDIGFLQRLRVADPLAHADSLMSLVEEVLTYFDFRALASVPSARWFKSQNNVPFGDRLMHEHNCFAAAVTLSYRVL